MYKTQLEAAKKGIITPQMLIVAEKEQIDVELLKSRIAKGSVVIPANIHHTSLSPEGVGEGLKTKINVNLGISGDAKDYSIEMKKVDLALKYKAESIMDLSNVGVTSPFRKALIQRSTAMIGTVPMYDAIGFLGKPLAKLTVDDWFRVVEHHAIEGVDFMTIHAGVNQAAVKVFKQDHQFDEARRLTAIVSRGGSLLFAWMEMTGNENPFYEHYDRLLELMREHDVTISLGDALRPGSTHDATDASQITELIHLGQLTLRARDAGVQVMIEGPGHMPLDQIAANVMLEKRLCHNAPLYVLGPLVTDIAPGYDHITSAIGGAICAAAGADFLCYVTPAEHLCLPDPDDVKEGIIATKIAAHAGDMIKNVKGAREWDDQMSRARNRLDWEAMFRLALDGEKARMRFENKPPEEEESCSMCGKMCAIRTSNKILTGETLNPGYLPGEENLETPIKKKKHNCSKH